MRTVALFALVLTACSRAPDMATSKLIGRWNLEGPFSPEQRAAAVARGENPEQWDAWATAVTKSGKLKDPTLYFEFHTDGRAVFPVLPPMYMLSGAVETVDVMIQKEGRWEAIKADSGSTQFRVIVPADPDAEFTCSARFETPDRIIVSALDGGPLSKRAWVRRVPQ